MRNFKNNIEREFYSFLIQAGYAKTTAAHYVTRIRKIKDADQLIKENIDTYIKNYESGSNANLNKKSHKAYSCALKRFKEFANGDKIGKGRRS